MSKDKPIIMSTESVRAILAGRKTQTRRVCKPQPECRVDQDSAGNYGDMQGGGVIWLKPPYKKGDRIWVKESYIHCDNILKPNGQRVGVTDYRANRDNPTVQWKNSMFMPREFSRLTIEVTDVRLEQLQDMTIDDALAEGFDSLQDYISTWNKLNAKRGFSWESNPYVWVIDFKRIKQ